MLEHLFTFQRSDQQVLERVVDSTESQRLRIAHGVLPPDQAAPRHKTDSDVHLIIVRGTLALRIADQMIHTYEAGTIVFVPCGVLMEARSAGPENLEFFTIQTARSESLVFAGV